MKVTGYGLKGPNWVTWQVRMMSLLALCEVKPYVHSEIKQPNKEDNPIWMGKVFLLKEVPYMEHLKTAYVPSNQVCLLFFL